MFRRAVAFALFFLITSLALRASAEPEKLKVVVPEKDNLQYMTFWIAKGAGLFLKHGIDLEMVVAPQPAKAESMFDGGEGDAAVLPPPMYLRMIAAQKPIVLVASLLRNDPINLVVHKEVLEARKLTPQMPIADRVKGLRGMKIGIAPHPPARLRALLATQGMSTEKDIDMVVINGKEQNAAFHEKKVDALYAHTPYLERAIVADDGVVLIDQSAGEVPELAHRLIHAFVVRKAVHEGRSHIALAAVKALAEAQAMIHRSKKDAVAALAKEYPTRPRKELETIVDIYERAIPETPDVRIEDIAPALELFPEGVPKPELAGVDLKPFVSADIAAKARGGDGGRAGRMIVIVIGSLVAVVSILFLLKNRKSGDEKTDDTDEKKANDDKDEKDDKKEKDDA